MISGVFGGEGDVSYRRVAGVKGDVSYRRVAGVKGDDTNRGVTLDEKSCALINTEYRKNDPSNIVELRCNIEGYYDQTNIVNHWLPWNKS